MAMLDNVQRGGSTAADRFSGNSCFPHRRLLDVLATLEFYRLQSRRGVSIMLILTITFAALVAMAASGAVAARAPRSLVSVRRADDEPRQPTAVF